MEFRPITLADKSAIDALLVAEDKQGTEFCFTSLYSWALNFDTLWCPLSLNGHPGFVLCSGGYGYLFSGSPDPEVVNGLLAAGKPFTIMGMSREECETLSATFGDAFSISPHRDSFDYIYLAQDLLTLKGKKWQAKRNLLNNFKREYPQCTVEPITAQNIADCMDFNERWCATINCSKSTGLRQETCAVRRILNHFEALRVEGLLVRLNGLPVAYTVGEPLNSNTYIVHIEKAFIQYKGLYQFINQTFVERTLQKYPQTVYINREDDSGDQGLRLAKLSYQPAYLLEKFVATPLRIQ